LRRSCSFQKPRLFHVESTETEIHCLQDGGVVMSTRVSSATVPYHYLSIDYTLSPQFISPDTPFYNTTHQKSGTILNACILVCRYVKDHSWHYNLSNEEKIFYSKRLYSSTYFTFMIWERYCIESSRLALSNPASLTRLIGRKIHTVLGVSVRSLLGVVG